MNIGNYAKLIVALIGAAIIALETYTGIDFAAQGVTPEAIMKLVTPFLFAAGVWAVPNSGKS